jgi:hypothetical protein
MSVLKSLKLASAAPTNASSDPKQRVREKVVQSPAEQSRRAWETLNRDLSCR